MSVENTTSKVIYQGNGVAVEWPVPFAYSRADDICLLRTDVDGNETEIASNFRLNVNASGDSSVTYPVAGEPLPPGVKLTVYRKTPQTQIVDLQYGGAFSPETLEKDGFDRVVMMVQEVREEIDRAVKIKLSATESPNDLRDRLFAARDQAQAASAAAGQSAEQAAGSAGEAAASAATATEQADRAQAEADRAQTAAENAEAIAGAATETTLGGLRLATQAQAEAGDESGAYAMTPLRVSQHLNAKFPKKFTAALNAQTSAASAANKIPQADENGKLATGWLPSLLCNTRTVLTTSGQFTPTVTGWHRIVCIGGGGSGGRGGAPTLGGLGGLQGGTTSFGDLAASGGSGGSGGGGGGNYTGGGGGGGAGEVAISYVHLAAGVAVAVAIGAGAPRQNSTNNGIGGAAGQGPFAGAGVAGSVGGCGAAGASNGSTVANGGLSGAGGAGGRNWVGYGGGGGGGAGTFTGSHSSGGSGADGASGGGATSEGGYGGAGGNGAVIIEYFDPTK